MKMPILNNLLEEIEKTEKQIENEEIINIRLEDIKGAIIDEFQSIDLLYLLGVKLKQ